jgi:uncharacterized membrane protein YvbJ
MALINCPECGKEISNSAVTCPHCGIKLLSFAAMKAQMNKKKSSKPKEVDQKEIKKIAVGLFIFVIFIWYGMGIFVDFSM